MKNYYLVTLCLWVFIVLCNHNKCFGCLEKEKIALLELKNELLKLENSARKSNQDYYDHLSIWGDENGNDCCAWERVQCNNTTRQVVQLSIDNVFLDDFFEEDRCLNASLFLPFEELQHLDLSYNSFTELKGLDSLSKLEKLHFLDLEGNNFNSSIIPSLSALASLKTLNLSFNRICDGSLTQGFNGSLKLQKLEVLDLSYNYCNNGISQDWKNMSKLEVLYLGYNNFSRGIPQSILALNSLQGLSLPRSNLNGPIPSGLCELKNLKDLDLSENKFDGILPPCFKNLTSLTGVDLSYNRLYGNIPSLFSKMKSLEFLSLGGNRFNGGLDITSPLLSNQLKFLDLSNCNLNISIINVFKFLHNQYDLRFVDLSHNNLHGSFPNWLIENNKRLEFLVLKNNSLTGSIQLHVNVSLLSKFDVSKNHIEGKLQTDIGVVLSKLRHLNLSKNNIEGTLPTSLGNIKNLNDLDLSRNSLEGTLPPSLGNIKYLHYLDFSSNKLSGEISPSLFNLTNLKSLRLSNNQFIGSIPTHNVGVLSLRIFDISQNQMSGRIPSWIGQSSPSLATLILRNNSFHGPIPLNLCKSNNINFLDLSHNHLSGPIPSYLNLTSLEYLHLQENKFFAPIPKSILQSSNLITLDLRHNNLSGNIPRWFGFLRNLRVVLLKGNHLRGSIPHQMCQLTKISILDLSHNTLSGSIPPCFSNITFGKNGSVEHAFDIEYYEGFGSSNLDYKDVLSMGNSDSDSNMYFIYSEQEEVEFMTKSGSGSYKGDILKFMAGMDLSYNYFTGNIPSELGMLTTIRALNLSYNRLTGSIPNTLSNLNQLESMDLSYNSLTGEIPSELSDIYTLSVFSVAYNNLTGRIPDMKAQFNTFDERSYEGNLFLCGPPLQHQCNAIPVTTTIIGWSEKLNIIDPITFIASFVATYIVCLLGFVIVLCINPYWRRMWFNFIDACLSFIFPFWSEVIYK